MRLSVGMLVLVMVGGCTEQRVGLSGTGQRGLTEREAADAFLVQYAETRRFSHGLPSAIRIAPDGSSVLFLRSGPRSFVRDLYEFEVASRQERVLLTAEQILRGGEEVLSEEELARRERMRQTARGISAYELSEDGSQILVPLSGRLFVIRRQDGRVTELRSEAGFPLDAHFSPDGRYVACVREGDLFVSELASGGERRLTHKAAGHITNGLSEFVAQEEMGRFSGYWWSPDSQAIAYQQTDTSMVETLHVADAMNPGKPPADWPYPRPGKANADVRLGILPVGGGETTWVEWDRQRYPYLATVRWKKNAPLTLVVQNRTQTEMLVLAADAATGSTALLVRETDPAWINIDQDVPHWLPDGQSFLWTSERAGDWALELRDRDGGVARTLLRPEFGFRGIVSVDEQGRSVIVSAGREPHERQLYRLSLVDEAAEPVALTSGAGVHAGAFSKDHTTSVRWSESLAGRSAFGVHRDGSAAVGELTSAAESAPFEPNVELTVVEGSRKFHAALVRPRGFEAGRRYPVIEYVYGGPGGTQVSGSAYAYLLDQWLADHGYIVVRIDGRGTPGRDREWERAIKNDFIDVPLADHVEALAALGRRYRELDMSRVGIYGWSFGGYFSAMAVMQAPHTYHAGVAGAPVADWLDYDTHYTERYLGLPDDNAAGYEASSVLTHAPKLTRPLLIMHGTTDDNVYFTHSLKMSDALMRAGRPHEFLPLSNFTHMVADPNVTVQISRRIVDFFDAQLSKVAR